MLAGIRCTGTIHARAQSQVLMNNLKISHGKSISSVKQLVQDMDPERMKDLSVETSIDQARISGTATGWILVVWKPQEMHAGIPSSGTIHARVQSLVLMKFIRPSPGKTTLNAKQSVQGMDPERMKDLSVPIRIDQTKISGTATGWILVVWKLQEMLVGTQSSGMIHVRAQNQASMKFIRPLPGKTTLNAKQSVQGMVQKRMKDLSVPTWIDLNKISGNVIGKTLDVYKQQEMLAGIHSFGMVLAMVQSLIAINILQDTLG